MERLLICNARIVNEGHITEGDVLIESGRIVAVGDVSAPEIKKEQVLDAAGNFLLPGMIDNCVHFRDPGATPTPVADMASESSAAVAGGVTTFLDAPDLVSGTRTLAALEDKKQRAQGRSRANFGFYLGAGRDNLELIKSLDPQLACGVDVHLGCNVENDARLLDDMESVECIFRDSPILVSAYCEDMPTIIENEESFTYDAYFYGCTGGAAV